MHAVRRYIRTRIRFWVVDHMSSRLMTFEEMKMKIKRLPEKTIQALEKDIMLAALNVEAQARKNCTPGRSPYYRAPYSDDNDPNREPPHMQAVMTSSVEIENRKVIGIVGNPKHYALFVHDGTTRMRARPFILDAITEKEDETLEIISAAVASALIKECI